MADKHVWRRDILRTVPAGALGVGGNGIYSNSAAGERTKSGSVGSTASQGVGTATGWEQVTKLAADDGDAGDNFGSSVAVSGNGTTAIVGAFVDEHPNGELAGSAYVFSKSGGSWTQQAKLAADDGDAGDNFGSSVAVSDDGTTAIIGAEDDNDPNGSGAGSAYVFRESGGVWTQQAKLAADDGDSGDQFGSSVAMSGDGTIAVIGAQNDEDPNGLLAGSAYVFSVSEGNWNQQTKLAAGDDSFGGDAFGSSVAISGDGSTGIIGAQNDNDPNGSVAGSAYVFSESGGQWTQQAKIAAADGDSQDLFGSSVAVSGDGTTAIIGAISDEDPNGTSGDGFEGPGSAYVFSKSGGTWTQQEKLAADDGDAKGEFGSSVAVSGDGTTAVIGAQNEEDPNGTTGDDFGGSGSAYVFSDSGGEWTQQTKLAAADGDSGDQFGSSVAVSGDGTIAIFGARGDEDPSDLGAGSAYVFSSSSQTGGGNTPPTPSFTVSPSSPSLGQSVTFDASDSTDDGSITTYEWDFGDDGSYEMTGETVTRTFDSEGETVVNLRVTDDEGVSETTSQTITVTRDAFEDAVQTKLSTATELDEMAVHLSEKSDVEELIDQLRTDIENDTFNDPGIPTGAVKRLRLGESLAQEVVVTTSNEEDGSNSGTDQLNIAVETTEFIVQMGVSLLLSKLSLTKAIKNSRFSSLIQDSEWIASTLDEAFSELIMTHLPRSVAPRASQKIKTLALNAYDEMTAGRFNDSSQFQDYLSESISSVVSELTVQRTIQSGEGVALFGGIGTLPLTLLDRYVNIESTLGRLNDRMRSEALQAEGLEGSFDSAEDANVTAEGFIQTIASYSDDFLAELQNKLAFVSIVDNVFSIVTGLATEEVELEVWDIIGLIGSLLPSTGAAVATVRLIGVYVGNFTFRMLMAIFAVGIVDIEEGRRMSIDSLDNLLPDTEEILNDIETAANRWEEFA